MTAGKWVFTFGLLQPDPNTGGPSKIKTQIDQLSAFANDAEYPVHIQLEACGTTIKGMQNNGAKDPLSTLPLDEKAVYPGILVNQGAIGRLIDLEQNNYVYVQEE